MFAQYLGFSIIEAGHSQPFQLSRVAHGPQTNSLATTRSPAEGGQMWLALFAYLGSGCRILLHTAFALESWAIPSIHQPPSSRWLAMQSLNQEAAGTAHRILFVRCIISLCADLHRFEIYSVTGILADTSCSIPCGSNICLLTDEICDATCPMYLYTFFPST